MEFKLIDDTHVKAEPLAAPVLFVVSMQKPDRSAPTLSVVTQEDLQAMQKASQCEASLRSLRVLEEGRASVGGQPTFPKLVGNFRSQVSDDDDGVHNDTSGDDNTTDTRKAAKIGTFNTFTNTAFARSLKGEKATEGHQTKILHQYHSLSLTLLYCQHFF